ncbi:pyridoxine 5'-phosphate synthase [Sulfurimonas sp. MAG313]|nr:pyridoxine 5'-phosphate synthase [Sulfurimonas sp. MAG313]MDF1881344.1 pyridoxine 5'-phosphate synthase [Sulfurimonas sp. MAG313]
MQLGVNIDHIAVLREARQINDPDPVDALGICKRAGADQITIHLREDRRHINDLDAQKIMFNSALPVNLECSIDSAIIDIICKLKPHRATLVPEKREEVTTEGGLDVLGQFDKIKEAVDKLKSHEIDVSLFIDPNSEVIEQSAKLDIDMVELHTGSYANIYAMLNTPLATTHHSIKDLELPRHELKQLLFKSLEEIQDAAYLAHQKGILVAAGHGLNYQNVHPIKDIEPINELNIGQSIIARSVFTGLEQAILDMKELLK